MNRARPYVNRFVKRKQQQIQDSYHSTNLKEMKPINSKLMEHSETIIINHGKRQMIKQVRQIQIERQNKLLLQKIASVMGKKGAYSVAKTKTIRTKVNKSLNQIYRKRQNQHIQLENKRFLQRLQNKRATLNTQKLNKQWVQNKSTIRRMANIDFYLTNIKSASRMRSITSERFYKSKYDKMRLIKQKVVDGEKMLIKIQFIGDMLKIIGDSQDSRDIKIIEIPKQQAITFIQKDCQGKFQLIIQKLKYDAQSQTLYLVSQHLEEEDNIDFNFNPQIDKIMINKGTINKRTPETQRINKSSLQHGKKSIKDLSNQTLEPQMQKSKTINVTSQANIPQHKVHQKQINHSNKTEAKVAPKQFQHNPSKHIEKIEEKGEKNKTIEHIEEKQKSEVKKYQSAQEKEEVEEKQDRKEMKERQEIIKEKEEIKAQGNLQHENQPQQIKQQEHHNEVQQEQYEEQFFEQSHNKPEEELIESKAQNPNEKQIVLEAESPEDYDQQFEASAQVKKIEVQGTQDKQL